MIAEPAADQCRAGETHCITCGDEGVAMRVVAPGDPVAVCRDDHGALHEIAIDLVTPIAIGDGVLVHAGVAIGRLGARA